MPDDEPVWIGHYREVHTQVTASEAIAIVMHADDAAVFEVLRHGARVTKPSRTRHFEERSAKVAGSRSCSHVWPPTANLPMLADVSSGILWTGGLAASFVTCRCDAWPWSSMAADPNMADEDTS